jgi:hypothetical protein
MTTSYEGVIEIGLSNCAVHGGDQRYVWSYICNGYICIECVKDNLFIEDIEKEIVEHYPKLFERAQKLFEGP